jgi:hypothetical protein
MKARVYRRGADISFWPSPFGTPHLCNLHQYHIIFLAPPAKGVGGCKKHFLDPTAACCLASKLGFSIHSKAQRSMHAYKCIPKLTAAWCHVSKCTDNKTSGSHRSMLPASELDWQMHYTVHLCMLLGFKTMFKHAFRPLLFVRYAVFFSRRVLQNYMRFHACLADYGKPGTS